jgi:uncharacterized membrane protein YdjX (TVP38/TMEM64 family)
MEPGESGFPPPGWRTLLLQPGGWWLLVFAFLPAISGSVLSLWALSHPDWFSALGIWAWCGVFLFLSFLIAFSFIPNTLAGLVSGYFLGFWALPGMVFSFMLASWLGYGFARRIDPGLRLTLMKIWPSTESLFRKLGHDPIALVAGLRMLPVPTFSLGSLVLAWLRVPLRPYLLGSFMGMLPRMTLMVLLGTGAHNIVELVRNPFSSDWLTSLTAILTIAGAVLLYRSMKNRQP